MRNLLLALATVLLSSTTTLADATSTAAPAAQPAAAPAATASNDQQLVCRYVAVQGMIVKRKVCKTKDEWDNLRHSGQRDIEKMQQAGYQQGR